MEYDSLFVQKVSNPKHSLSLFHLHWIQAKSRTPLVQTNTVRKSDGSCNEKKGRLGVWCPLQEKRLRIDEH